MTGKPIRVRFAPSPTGHLHIGGVRTALFNWFFARKAGGVFILRIEDTDEKRSTPESIGTIIDGLRWLGIDWDEGPADTVENKATQKGSSGPYFQMERIPIYREWADKLVRMGRAYPCWCTKDDRAAKRQDAIKDKKTPGIHDRCRDLPQEERQSLLDEHKPFVFRFKVEKTDHAGFTDLIHGRMDFDTALVEDFVILKSTGGPTYNFAAVVDDHLMGITHVIRGDDHLSNTPRQVLLYRALKFDLPAFAHLSMILGPDGSRLSKRHGAASLDEYKADGYVPDALINYCALLGWATEDSQQLFTRDELIEKFSLERCSKSSSIFDPQKLVWMNGEYIRALSAEELTRMSMPWLKEAGYVHEDDPLERIQQIVGLEQEKIKLLKDVPGLVSFMLADDVQYQKEAVDTWLATPAAHKIIEEIKDLLHNVNEFSVPVIEQLVRNYAKANGIKTAAVFHPLRVAVSGRTKGPSLFEMIVFIGKERIVKRLENVLTQ